MRTDRRRFAKPGGAGEMLKPGDVLETEIVGIGVLRNVITAA